MKKLFALVLALALLLSFPVRADEDGYYAETALPDGSRIVYTEREANVAPHFGTVYTYDKCGVVAPDGSFLVEPVYNSITAPVEGRAMFKSEDGYGYFDEDWNVVIPAQYAAAHNFSEGLAAVSNSQWAVGYIDRDGNTVVPFKYSTGGEFKNGLAQVSISEEGYSYHTFNRTGTIDKEGNVVDPLVFRFEEKTFDVLMTENLIDINGTVYKNDSLTYPFINYLGYSYIPLTYGTCRALGFSCDWSAETGLVLKNTPDLRAPELGKNTMKHGVYDKATLYTGTLTIDGKTYTAGDFYYPLLFYRDIVYFPILYREGMERLGINYSFRRDGGESTPGYMVFEKD